MSTKKRVVCLVVAFVMMFTVVPTQVLAASSDDNAQTSEENLESNEIIAIEGFSSSIAKQKVSYNNAAGVNLPDKINVKLNGNESYVSIDLNWNKSEVSKAVKKLGKHKFTPSIDSKYVLSGVKLPTIEINVVKASTKVKGLDTSRSQKARSTMSDYIYITPGYSRTVKLQMKKSGKWRTMKTYKTSKNSTAKLKLVYSKDWWYKTKSYWRVVVSSTNTSTGYISKTVTVKAKKYYQNPKKYVQIKDKITLKSSGGYNLSLGYMGFKVRKVNSYFHIGNRYWPRYTYTTRNKVKAFQKRKHLKVTGVVDKKTWLKMGFSSSSWYNLGAYVTPVKVTPASTKSQHIETMISTAKKYLGDDYVVGGSGRPGQGTDCSGLVMQALYSAGVDPYPVSVVRHSKPGYEYESRNLYKNKKFKTVSYRNKKRGDLIFYCGGSGVVNHVAIYLGNGKVIESCPNRIVISDIRGRGHTIIKGVKRVFN